MLLLQPSFVEIVILPSHGDRTLLQGAVQDVGQELKSYFGQVNLEDYRYYMSPLQIRATAITVRQLLPDILCVCTGNMCNDGFA